MKIDPKDCCLLVVDFQEKLVPAMEQPELLVKNTSILIECMQLLHVPTIVSTQYRKGLGETIEPLRNLLSDCESFDKTTFSCVADPHIQVALQATGKKTIIVCGIESHICVLQTVIDLKSCGYTPVLVADCTTSRKASDHQYALLRAQSEGVLITSYESILFELVQKAGTSDFKEVSKRIK